MLLGMTWHLYYIQKRKQMYDSVRYRWLFQLLFIYNIYNNINIYIKNNINNNNNL